MCQWERLWGGENCANLQPPTDIWVCFGCVWINWTLAKLIWQPGPLSTAVWLAQRSWWRWRRAFCCCYLFFSSSFNKDMLAIYSHSGRCVFKKSYSFTRVPFKGLKAEKKSCHCVVIQCWKICSQREDKLWDCRPWYWAWYFLFLPFFCVLPPFAGLCQNCPEVLHRGTAESICKMLPKYWFVIRLNTVESPFGGNCSGPESLN